MKENTGVIYRYYNRVNGKSYVGQTTNFNRRERAHTNGNGSNSRTLHNAIKKYGKDAFVVEILEEDVPEELLNKLEILHIRFWNCVSPKGYNLTSGGERAIPCDDTRRKMSEAKKGKPSPRKGVKLSLEVRRQMSECRKGKRKGQENHFFGKKHTPESIQRMVEAQTGKKHSPETRRRMSEAHRGEKNHFFGKSFSPEMRERMSEAHRGQTPWNKGKTGINSGEKNPFYGKKHTPESLWRMSESHKNISEETRLLMSEAKKGKRPSPETRRRMSEAQKKRHARKRAERANYQLED